jgi:hypothetical protein
MLHELDQPAFIEVVEKASDVSVQNVVHFLLQERVRQRVQRIVLAASRAKTIRKAKKVLFLDLVEDSGHSVLDDLIFQGRNPKWTLPSIFFLYVHPSRRQPSVRSPMDPTVQID